MTWQRFALLPLLAARDAGAAVFERERPRRRLGDEDALRAAVRWLCATHDATGRRGSSKGFSLLFGWAPAFPETSGYLIGTLLACARRLDDPRLRDRARELGDWEIEVQRDDGGVIEGLLTDDPKPSTVFNTGMVMHGWLDLHAEEPSAAYLAAAERGGEFLVANQRPDGTWSPSADYYGIPHTYNARVSWALLRLAEVTRDARLRDAAVRQLEWVLSRQRPNGWFDDCVFKPGMLPSTHAIAYTLRGLLESGAILGDERFTAAAARTAGTLAGVLESAGWLSATYDQDWKPAARYECLTGTAQLGGVFLRLHDLTGDDDLRRAGLKAVEQAAARQCRVAWSPIHGALPGSFPIFGRYAPLQYPNWATKFLVDALLQRERAIA